MTGLRVIAPAKINWTLEVLRARPDGYHEIRSVLQTIDLYDIVTLEPARKVAVELRGDATTLAGEDPEQNLAYRAAMAFRERAGIRRGVHITLEKRVPIAAGLGGGSSDAAAVLRGLNALWDAGQPEFNLIEIAGEIGSDPPFFIAGGTVEVSGRGELVTRLRDAVAATIVLAVPPPAHRGEKTATMYAALTPDHYAEGDATIGVRETVEAGRPILDEELANVFERVAAQVQPETAMAMGALSAQGHAPHLCGSGPSYFLLVNDESSDAAAARIAQHGFEPRLARTLGRADATRIERI
jgi:4-diphosphocytidyl-2-C-methyl-D-erythritol kinase